MFNFFLTLCFIVTKFCVLECLIIWMHKKIYIYSSSSLMKWFFSPLRNSVYIHFTGYQMKAYHIDLINILINQN